MFTNARRRSNSSTASHHRNDFKTKFKAIEPEPVFEEDLHGASALSAVATVPDFVSARDQSTEKLHGLEKGDSNSSSSVSEFEDYLIVKA